MNHLILEKFSQLELLLHSFFQRRLTRKDKPENLLQCDEDIFQLATQIYKRGFIFYSSENYQEPEIGKQIFFTEVEFYSELKNFSSKKTFFIIDKNVSINHPNLLKVIKNSDLFLFLSTEENKNLSNALKIISEIPEDCVQVIAIGGGILLDLAGFTCGILNIAVTYVPTTLLAAIDAGVGGKTGVNFFPYGKNQIGLFKEATLHFCVPELFQTLSKEQITCGLIEALKHAWIFGTLSEDMPLILKIYRNNYSNSDLCTLINRNLKYKTSIVLFDFYETKNIRAALNLGHTFAHVLEALAEKRVISPLSHGIAVAHGINFLLKKKFIKTSENILGFDDFLTEVINMYPVIKNESISLEYLKTLFLNDKKNEDASECVLSLPKYGHFQLGTDFSNLKPVTFRYKLEELVNALLNYIN